MAASSGCCGGAPRGHIGCGRSDDPSITASCNRGVARKSRLTSSLCGICQQRPLAASLSVRDRSGICGSIRSPIAPALGGAELRRRRERGGEIDSGLAHTGVTFAAVWVATAAASPPWPGDGEARGCEDVGGDSGFGVVTSQVRSAEARALDVGGSDNRRRTDSSCAAWPSERSGWTVVNEHAAKSAVRSMGCPSVHVPASVLLRDPSGRASHPGPRWMSRYLPQTVLSRAMRGLAQSAQRHATERASHSHPIATSRRSLQGAPSAQPAGSGRRAWAAQGARPGQRRSRRLARFATWAGARTDSARSRSCTQKNPAEQIAKSEHAGGAARGANPEQRRSRRTARFATWAGARTGPARSRSCTQKNPAGQIAKSEHAGGAAQGARPAQRRSRRAARFATWAGARTVTARSRSCAQGALSSSRARFAACGDSRESLARAAIPARSLGASI